MVLYQRHPLSKEDAKPRGDWLSVDTGSAMPLGLLGQGREKELGYWKWGV